MDFYKLYPPSQSEPDQEPEHPGTVAQACNPSSWEVEVGRVATEGQLGQKFPRRRRSTNSYCGALLPSQLCRKHKWED
jgi:hypothetical protein